MYSNFARKRCHDQHEADVTEMLDVLWQNLSVALERFFITHAYMIIGGAVFLAAIVLFAYWTGRFLRFVLVESLGLDSRVSTLSVRTFRIAVVLLAVITVLDEFGIEITSLIAALGIIGFAIAIGLRTTTTNLFTGIVLRAVEPYVVGDTIEGERVEGVVESINLFHTVVVSADGVYVSVPNGPMWARSIRNLSRIRPSRLDLNIRTGHELAFSKMKPLIVSVLQAEPDRCHEFESLVRLEEVADDAITIRAAIWCKQDTLANTRSRLLPAIKNGLSSAGATVIEITDRKKSATVKKRSTSREPAGEDVI